MLLPRMERGPCKEARRPHFRAGISLPGSAHLKKHEREFFLEVTFHLISDFLVEDTDPVPGI